MAGESPTEGHVSVCQDGLRWGVSLTEGQCPCSATPRCLLESLPLVLSGWLVVCLTGVERQLSAPQVPWLRPTTAASTSEEEGLHAPSSSQLPRVHLRRRCVLRRRKDCTQAFLFTTSARTSEEEGKAFFLTKSASSSEEEEQVFPPHNVGLYFGGGGTGLLPHNVGEYMQLVLRCVLSMSASRGVPRCECACVGEQRKLIRWVTTTHLEENSSGASWGEGVAVGPRFHSPRRRPLKVCRTRNSKLQDAVVSREPFKEL